MTTLSGPDPARLRRQLAGACWIWGGPDPRPVNAFRLFRKDFRLDATNADFDLLVFAEARYQAFLNDQFVQAGPLPCQPARRLVDRPPVRRFLRTGRNSLTFIVYCPGVMTGQWTLTNPGLLAMLCSADGRLCVPRVSGRHPLHRPDVE